MGVRQRRALRDAPALCAPRLNSAARYPTGQRRPLRERLPFIGYWPPPFANSRAEREQTHDGPIDRSGVALWPHTRGFSGRVAASLCWPSQELTKVATVAQIAAPPGGGEL